jgi:signal transduction histidine kinase
VVLNLVTNAREAITGGGEIRVETCLAPNRPGWACLRVSDTGPGIPPDIQPRIFDPFFTTKDGGTGLGLSVSYGIIKGHNGFLEVATEPGHGTTFTVLLPPAGQRSA